MYIFLLYYLTSLKCITHFLYLKKLNLVILKINSQGFNQKRDIEKK